MVNPLAIRADGDLDFLALGSVVTRLDSGVVPFRKATTYAVHVSGGEFNVAANLADAFGLRTGIATAIVDYPIGELVSEHIRALGVTPYFRRFQHDGVTGPNIASVYSDRGLGVRAPVVFYNRANEASARLGPGDFDWAQIFGAGVRWFHSGGIFASLSATTPELIVEAMQAAHASGGVVSFDLNYRQKLWQASGGQEAANDVLRRIVKHVDVLIGNEEDLQAGLGIPGPDIHRESALDPKPFLQLINRVVQQFPNIRVVATTLREVQSASRHRWSAVAWAGGETLVAPTTDLDIHDRVGGGDGFGAGLIFGLLTGESLDESLKLGWAHGALLTTFPGDTTMATLDQVRAVAAGRSARIQR